jgi:DnaJ domain
MKKLFRWGVFSAGCIVALFVYGVWREYDRTHNGGILGGFLSGLLRGGLIIGGLAVLWSWARKAGEPPRVKSANVVQEESNFAPRTRIKTHYDNLQVARSASDAVIRAAYRSLSQKYHPDKNAGNAEAERIMKILNDAHDTLIDPVRRRAHDEWVLQGEASAHEKEGGGDEPQQRSAPVPRTQSSGIQDLHGAKGWKRLLGLWIGANEFNYNKKATWDDYVPILGGLALLFFLLAQFPWRELMRLINP